MEKNYQRFISRANYPLRKYTFQKKNINELYNPFFRLYPELAEHAHHIHNISAGEAIGFSSRLDYEIAQEIKSQNKKLVVFFDGSEPFTERQCKKVYNIVQLAGLKKDQFCYVTGSINAAKDFAIVKNNLNLPYDFNLLSTNVYADVVKAGQAKPQFSICTKPKIFNCLNKNHRAHRGMLIAHLIENNLLTKSITSLYGGWNDTEWFENMCQTIEIKDLHLPSVLRQNKELFPMHVNANPLTKSNPIWVDADDAFIYNDTYFSLVTETLFFQDRFDFQSAVMIPGIFVTEKTYKPIIMKHPFVIAALPNFLSSLRELGLKTFHPFILEDYDNEIDDYIRLKMITAEVIRLSKFTDTEWLEWLSNIQPIVEHNYQWITSNPKLGISNVSKIIEILGN